MPFPRDDEGEWTFHYGGVDSSGDVVVTMGFFCNTSSDYDQDTNDAVADAWEDVVAVTLCSQMKFLGLSTIINDSTNVLQFESPRNVSGGLTGNTMLPLNNAVVVKKQTGLAGRRFRGRLYLPGIPEDAVDDAGRVLGSFLTTINTAMAAFATAVSTTVSPNCQVALLHKDIVKEAKPEYVLESIPHTLITSLVADVEIGSQRGRLLDH